MAPIFFPMSTPTSADVRKCTPSHTRAFDTSRTRSSTRVQVLIDPPAEGLAVSSGGIAPPAASASRTAPTAAATMQCAQGYSGCSGVSMNGIHAGSRSVASFPSLSPLRIAVTGRQKP